MKRSTSIPTRQRGGSGRGERGKAQALGAKLRELREERGISAATLAKQAGVSRSYLNYLETGKFAEVGLDKFSRLVAALGLSADQVLREAGFLPGGAEGLPDARTYLGTQYRLSPPDLEHALAFLEFLANRQQPREAAKTRKSGRKQ